MLTEPFRNALILTGPTGSGKTEIAVELAERLGAEIISMDSMAVYRGMDIGTAKPGPELRRRVPHHLLDVLDPWESGSVAWWLQQAATYAEDIQRRGRRVLFAGGTPMYLKALLRGLFDGPPADLELRERLLREADMAGGRVLHERLSQVDPAAAARLHPNDRRRIIRALEVWHLTGKPLSSWQKEWSRARDCADPAGMARVLCLELPRSELYARIDARVEHMIAAGLVEEVRALRRLPHPISRAARQALGYKELFAHLDGQGSLDQAVVQIKTRSRNFAKRQLTWFRHLPECRPVTKELTFAAWGVTMDG
jgi:tRNA dimethylallyltransferase